MERTLFAELVDAVIRFRAGTLPKDHPYVWISALDHEDQDGMLNEASQVLRRVGEYADGSGYDVDAIIHEWYESVMAAQSAEHRKAWDDIGKETPVALTPPPDILNARER